MNRLPRRFTINVMFALATITLVGGLIAAVVIADAGSDPPTDGVGTEVAAPDIDVLRYVRSVRDSLSAARIDEPAERTSPGYLPAVRDSLARLRAIVPPEPVDFDHADLIRHVERYMNRLDGEIEPFSRTDDLQIALSEIATSGYEACLDLQRTARERHVEEDLGCNDASVGVLRQCASGFGIPDVDFVESFDRAKERAEAIAGTSLPLPEEIPETVRAYGAGGNTLREPDYTDGELGTDDDDTREIGSATLFGVRDPVRRTYIYVSYAALPSCHVQGDRSVTLSSGTRMVVSSDGRGENRRNDELIRTYEIAQGSFETNDWYIEVWIEFDEPVSLSDKEQTAELVRWAETIAR